MKNYLIIFLLVLFCGCEKNVVFERNTRLVQAEWNYLDKPSYEINITDTNATYAAFINIRFEAEYNYSNLFFMFNMQMPDSTLKLERIECELFDKDGLPLGKGIGDLYFIRYRIPRITKFHQPGTYKFMLEQNMRIDHLKGIHDIGIRVEKVDSSTK
jgi:gliding motility-associated lipoprotein GldH